MDIITTAAILTTMVHGITLGGKAKLVANKIKNRIGQYILTDTLETIGKAQEDPQLLNAAQHKEVETELEEVFQDNPNLKTEIQQLLNKEAQYDDAIHQLVHQGRIINNQGGTYKEINTQEYREINTEKYTKNKQIHSGDGDNVAGNKIIHNKD